MSKIILFGRCDCDRELYVEHDCIVNWIYVVYEHVIWYWYTKVYTISESLDKYKRWQSVRCCISQDIICWILGHVCPKKCEE